MAEPLLAERFQEVLRARGASLPEGEARVSADFVRLLLRVAAPSGDHVERVLAPVAAALSARSGLAAPIAAELVSLAAAPEFRGVVDQLEYDAFVSRFGQQAARQLRQQDADVLDLEGYGAEHGPEEALRFVDAALGVLAADGLTGQVVRRVETAAEELGVDPLAVTALIGRHDRTAETGRSWALTGDRLRIGRSPGADIVLSDPQVALRHADLVRTDNTWRVVDAESGRPTVVNGRPVSSAPFHPGDVLRVGPYVLALDPTAGVVTAKSERVFTALSARDLDRKIGGVSLLEAVSFTVFSGEVIAMVGPSGAGKTTLLNAIAGVTPADTGAVEWDGQDFHAILAKDRSRVGVVPQDDIVLPELTVEESLFYSARLRFSGATDDARLNGEVERVLGELGIPHIRESRIGDALHRGISGGQRKRVNLGQELLTPSTRVLFLDEPTSGLDPRAAQDIVRLVRQLADRGRIVFLVTHDLSPQVMAQVDHLLVLAPGGRVAWFGPPAEACAYFSVPTPDAIFNRFAERTPQQWGEAFRASREYRTWVRAREALLELDLRPAPPAEPAEPATPPSPLQQMRTLVERYARTKLRDRTGLWVLAAQPPFLAVVMALVFPEPTSSMIFMLSLSCLWFGMSGAVRELISDRVVWRRERRVGVGVGAYVGSKLAVLGAINVLQCSFLAALAYIVFGLGGVYGFDPFVLMAVCSLTGIAGMTLGLFVSGVFSSSEAAVGMLPLLLIPQITFSSLLVGLRDMNPVARALTWLDPQRYAFDAALKVGEKLAKATRVPGQFDATSMTGPLYELGLKGAEVDDMGLSLPVLCAALLVFSALFSTGAVFAVWRRRE